MDDGDMIDMIHFLALQGGWRSKTLQQHGGVLNLKEKLCKQPASMLKGLIYPLYLYLLYDLASVHKH